MDKKKQLENSYKKAMKRNKGNKKAQAFITIVFLFLAGITLIFGDVTTATNNSTNLSAMANGKMLVNYIDVGQGDATLIQVNNKSLLIDAGPNKSSDKLVKYIKDLGITTIDYVVATHPHEDHIGGMDEIFDEFDVKNFLAPKVEHTTKTFEKMMISVANEGLKAIQLKAGSGNKIDLGDGTIVEIFSPIEDKYEELNDYSPIMKISYGDTSFVLTGDAEKLVEKEVIESGVNLNADVLKIGHHGSTTSSSEEFIKQVDPSIAVIPVGVGNDYGHPHKETLELLKKYNIKVLRSDELGDIVIESNGKDITVK